MYSRNSHVPLHFAKIAFRGSLKRDGITWRCDRGLSPFHSLWSYRPISSGAFQGRVIAHRRIELHLLYWSAHFKSPRAHNHGARVETIARLIIMKGWRYYKIHWIFRYAFLALISYTSRDVSAQAKIFAGEIWNRLQTRFYRHDFALFDHEVVVASDGASWTRYWVHGLHAGRVTMSALRFVISKQSSIFCTEMYMSIRDHDHVRILWREKKMNKECEKEENREKRQERNSMSQAQRNEEKN